MAAQEQAQSTGAIEVRVYHTRQDPRCRLCIEAYETVQQIVAGCKMRAGTAYMECHNQVVGIVDSNIWSQSLKVKMGDTSKGGGGRDRVLLDFQIQTDKQVMVNQLEICHAFHFVS